MSAAKKCDICGELYEPYNMGNYQQYHDPSQNFLDYNGIASVTMDTRGGFVPGTTMDCCPGCLNRIDSFIETIRANSKGMNNDNPTEAVHGLDIFTKNWCMNCAETEKAKEPVFNCENCEFKTTEHVCLIKQFARDHKHDYYMPSFGCMGE